MSVTFILLWACSRSINILLYGNREYLVEKYPSHDPSTKPEGLNLMLISNTGHFNSECSTLICNVVLNAILNNFDQKHLCPRQRWVKSCITLPRHFTLRTIFFQLVNYLFFSSCCCEIGQGERYKELVDICSLQSVVYHVTSQWSKVQLN